jgi:hypothetical protein
MKAARYFTDFYNEPNTRFHDSTRSLISRTAMVPLLTAKAARLKETAKKFIAAFIIVAGGAEHVTPYIATLNHDIPAMCERAELIDMSGQALELLNQVRKHTNTSRGGGSGGKGANSHLLVHQLAVADLCQTYVRSKYNLRASYYQQERLIGGHKGKQIEPRPLVVNTAKRAGFCRFLSDQVANRKNKKA